MQDALFPTSADPLTYGHLNIIEKALRLCERKLILVILNNKYKNTSLFQATERATLASKTLEQYFTLPPAQRSLPPLASPLAQTPITYLSPLEAKAPSSAATQNKTAYTPTNHNETPHINWREKIEIVTWDGMLHDFMLQRGIFTVIRGIRHAQDIPYERTLRTGYQTQLYAMGRNATFLYVMCDPTYQDISSTLVKKLAERNAQLHYFIPPIVKHALDIKLLSQYKIIVSGSMSSGKSTLIPQLIKLIRRQSTTPTHTINMDQTVQNIYADVAAGNLKDLSAKLAAYFKLAPPISKEKIKNLIFAPQRKNVDVDLKFLEHTLAPYIHSAYRIALADKNGIIFIEAPQAAEYNLLSEASGCVLFITCQRAERHRRLEENRNLSPAEAQRRMNLGLTQTEKLATVQAQLKNLQNIRLIMYDNTQPNHFTPLKDLAQTLLTTIEAQVPFN